MNRQFIPETIPDPSPGDPCGLFIDGLNFNWNSVRLEKLLIREGLAFTRLVRKTSTNCATVYFDNPADRRTAYERLSRNEWAGRQLFVVPLRRSLQLSQESSYRLRLRATSDLSTRSIRDRIAPWWSVPYEEQLRRKSEKYTQVIRDIVPRDSPPLEIFPAPKTENFRNKVELTVGFDLSGEVTVGFNLGSRVEDVIVPVSGLINVTEPMPAIAEQFRDFVISSGVPAFNRMTHQGTWKFILIRTTELGQSMLAVCTFGPLRDDVVASLHDAFCDKVTSLFYVETTAFESWGRNRVVKHLSGPEVIVERLCGLEFEISPMSFFQANTLGAQLLFEHVEEIAAVDSQTVLIDCCCGTGVIGLVMARRAKEVIGLDSEEDAIVDARRNAERNGIKNAVFVAAKAEDGLWPLLEEKVEAGDKIVCIVDPPRGGLHKNALKAIRNCEMITRLVYIACSPGSLVLNAQNVLMSTKITTTSPFRPVAWFGVDMCPHTDRLELVMLMER